MNEVDLTRSSERELLQLHSAIISELKLRGVVRTMNNPLGDYTEWLVAKALNLELAGNSTACYDGLDSGGTRFQIKGRRITPDSPSKQLSAIRNLDAKEFDCLAAVVFDQHYDIMDAVLVPHEVVTEYATYRKHVNAHILHLRGDILGDARVKTIDALKTTPE